jgi:hypothetical protein
MKLSVSGVSPLMVAGGLVLLLTANGVLSDTRLLLGLMQPRFRPSDMDEVSAYEARYAELRSMLPRYGVVGYVSDRADVVEAYYLAQYALSPVVVAHSADDDLVVGNFFDPSMAATILTSGHLEVVKDFGDGLMLLRRGAP